MSFDLNVFASGFIWEKKEIVFEGQGVGVSL